MENVPVLALHDAAEPVEKIAGALANVQPQTKDLITISCCYSLLPTA
jgi:hypothetical protein